MRCIFIFIALLCCEATSLNSPPQDGGSSQTAQRGSRGVVNAKPNSLLLAELLLLCWCCGEIRTVVSLQCLDGVVVSSHHRYLEGPSSLPCLFCVNCLSAAVWRSSVNIVFTKNLFRLLCCFEPQLASLSTELRVSLRTLTKFKPKNDLKRRKHCMLRSDLMMIAISQVINFSKFTPFYLSGNFSQCCRP